MSRRAVVVLVGAEALAAAYISLVAFLMSAWMVDEGVALRMSDADWLVAGCLRFFGWSLVAAAFAGVVQLAHRRLGLATASRSLSRLPVVMACFIALASGVGAMVFVIDRPFM